MPLPRHHLALSTIWSTALIAQGGSRDMPGALWALIAPVAQFMMDIDHLLDVFIYRRLGDANIEVKPLHSAELVALIVALSRSRIMSQAHPRITSAIADIGLGMAAHLILDLTVGGYTVPRLSLIYRAAHRFQTCHIGPWADVDPREFTKYLRSDINARSPQMGIDGR